MLTNHLKLSIDFIFVELILVAVIDPFSIDGWKSIHGCCTVKWWFLQVMCFVYQRQKFCKQTICYMAETIHKVYHGHASTQYHIHQGRRNQSGSRRTKFGAQEVKMNVHL